MDAGGQGFMAQVKQGIKEVKEIVRQLDQRNKKLEENWL